MMERLQNKFLIMLITAGALFHTACEGDKGETGPQGPQGEAGLAGKDGADGNTATFYFQQGLKGYEGTRDVAIYNRTDIFDDVTPAPTSEGKYLYVFRAENTDDPGLTDSVTTLLRFEGLAARIEEEYGEGICSGEFFINDATLYLSGVYNIPGGDGSHMQLGIYGNDAPLFDEISATWEKANENESWTIPGGTEEWSFNDTFFAEFLGGNYGYIHYLEPSPLKTIYHKPFYIPREAVMEWLCEGNNKGFLLAPFFDEGHLVIYSSEYSEQSLRPMLYLNIDRNRDNTRRKVLSSQEARKIWEQKTYEEKMEPLYQLYRSLRP